MVLEFEGVVGEDVGDEGWDYVVCSAWGRSLGFGLGSGIAKWERRNDTLIWMW